ncbi:MAG TPA: 4-hydroxythreonine-4-phosphate dehydrogenase PdxA [Desulforhopalus sp.]|nr:4-hydroxythreonine-4-phosphate dehydrogenase PdxA [Desulforhopalus sp.]
MLTIGITMGCPAGIGPEIILRSFQEGAVDSDLFPVILGDSGVLRFYGKILGIPAPCVPWHPGDKRPDPDRIPVVELSALPPGSIRPGTPDRNTGRAMARYISQGVELVGQGELDGLTTCPISKGALNDAGFHYPGHTEMLAHLTATREFTMMMAGPRLKVTLATIHCPLREVADALNLTDLTRLITLTDQALRDDFAITRPRLAVAGLNPHAGEDRLFGSEEAMIISPAVQACRALGIEVTGPYPPDTVFHRAVAGDFDAVVAMYHDQGLIPFKLLHFSDGVNVTLGLPLVRTSVDHGTAYDIAGKGLANPQSLQEAVKMAAVICRNRKTCRHPMEKPK